MDAGRLALLLLLALLSRGPGAGPARAARPRGERPGPRPSEPTLRPAALQAPETPPAGRSPAPLLQALLQAMKRGGRSPAFLFQPQRFGRHARRSPGSRGPGEGPSPLFWSLAAPQRFGRK